MADKISLAVAGRILEKFESYEVEADLYQAADAFRLTLGGVSFVPTPGSRCELHVNDTLELTGTIDRVEDGGDKNSLSCSLSGRDLMGLLVDSHVEEFADLDELPLKTLAERLLKPLPFINRKTVEYQQTSGGVAQKHARGDVGKTVFEILSAAARSRGVMFFAYPDGRMVFGRPKAKGKPQFHLIRRRDGRGNNVISGRRVRDISQRYSSIKVLGQQQGEDLLSAGEINVAATVTDPAVPYRKPLVVEAAGDGRSPEAQARMLLERQRFDGLQLNYRVARHSQGTANWAINALCQVVDEVLGIDGVYLITARTFGLSKQEGQTTELNLSLPGVVA
jgi:prophage tail gpP-like protein